mmetsp:Transcript_27188/g.60046  ORF Transcript_27188/g.60046 Transcript_27188/m.60046 type:complete len:258 (-) Transcript_27188:138-911(-)
MRCNGDRGNVAVIQKQDYRLSAGGLFFDNLCPVPALSASVVEEGGNDFVDLHLARCTLDSVVRGEDLHAVVDRLGIFVAVDVIEKVRAAADFTDSDGHELVRGFFGGFHGFVFDGSDQRPDSDLFGLCGDLCVDEFFRCFAVIDLSLVHRGQSGGEQLGAVVSPAGTLSHEHGTDDDATERHTGAVDLYASLEDGQSRVALGGVAERLGRSHLPGGSDGGRGLRAPQRVGCKHDVAILGGDEHLEPGAVEAVFDDSL